MKDLSVVLIVLAIIAGSFWVLAEFGGLSIRDHFANAPEERVLVFEFRDFGDTAQYCDVKPGRYGIEVQGGSYLATQWKKDKKGKYTYGPVDATIYTNGFSYRITVNGLENGRSVVISKDGCAFISIVPSKEVEQFRKEGGIDEPKSLVTARIRMKPEG